MLKQQIRQIVQANPNYAAITPAIEKEILHHDIMDVLVTHGAMQQLTFIGGTCLRMCYNAVRLSEDLDFNGGYHFKPSAFDGLETEIKNYLQEKYETEIWVSKPSDDKLGDTVSWKISIIKEANRPDLPHQKMHIDVCAIPSFDIQKRPLLNHYNIVAPTEGILIPVQSLEEMLADKLIALAYRARRIKPRDVWDIVWIKQRGVKISSTLVEKKLAARGKSKSDFQCLLAKQLSRLIEEEGVRHDFYMEISRFVPKDIKERTLDHPEYWSYVKTQIKEIVSEMLDESSLKNPFDMQ